MLHNLVVYLSFHLSKSDIKAHGILYSESLVFCMGNVQMCFHGAAILHLMVRLVHIVVHCMMYSFHHRYCSRNCMYGHLKALGQLLNGSSS